MNSHNIKFKDIFTNISAGVMTIIRMKFSVIKFTMNRNLGNLNKLRDNIHNVIIKSVKASRVLIAGL